MRVIGEGARRARMLSGGVALVVAVVFAASCGADGGDEVTVGSTASEGAGAAVGELGGAAAGAAATLSEAPDVVEQAELDWPAVAVGLADLTQVTDLLAGHDLPVRATVSGELNTWSGVVGIWAYEDGAWSQVSSFDLGADAEGLQVADVTGDGLDDLLVLSSGAANSSGIVLSNLDGSWTLVSFGAQDEHGPMWTMNPTIEDDGSIRDYVRSCIPNCAEGTGYSLLWRFDESLGHFQVDLTAGKAPDHTEQCESVAHEAASDFVSVEVQARGTDCGVASWLIFGFVSGTEEEAERLLSFGWECGSQPGPDDAELAFTDFTCDVDSVSVSWRQF